MVTDLFIASIGKARSGAKATVMCMDKSDRVMGTKTQRVEWEEQYDYSG